MAWRLPLTAQQIEYSRAHISESAANIDHFSESLIKRSGPVFKRALEFIGDNRNTILFERKMLSEIVPGDTLVVVVFSKVGKAQNVYIGNVYIDDDDNQVMLHIVYYTSTGANAHWNQFDGDIELYTTCTHDNWYPMIWKMTNVPAEFMYPNNSVSLYVVNMDHYAREIRNINAQYDNLYNLHHVWTHPTVYNNREFNRQQGMPNDMKRYISEFMGGSTRRRRKRHKTRRRR